MFSSMLHGHAVRNLANHDRAWNCAVVDRRVHLFAFSYMDDVKDKRRINMLIVFLITEPYPAGHQIMEYVGIHFRELKQLEIYRFTRFCQELVENLKKHQTPDVKKREEFVRTLLSQNAASN